MELGLKSLKDWIAERNADENAIIDREKMYTWFIDICSGVKYLHGNGGNGILHGNLKPSNLFLCPQETIKISDVGGIVIDEPTDSTNSESLRLYLPNDMQEHNGKTHIDVFSLGQYLKLHGYT